MDTRLKEEFLTCIVCQEVFRNPVTLHCGHTFCVQCVTAYTKTQTEAKKNESIPCPHCRGLTKVPDPQRPIEEWAGQIKTGFFVKGLVDTFLAKETGENVKCSYCGDEGEIRVASVWCPNCEKSLCDECQKSHRKFLPSHKVSDISSYRQDVREPSKRACEEHPDSTVDMFCQSCDVAACPRCCLTHHRSCVENIVPLADEMQRITSVLKKQAQKLSLDIEDLKNHIPRRQTHISNMESGDANMEANIENFGDRVACLIKTHLKMKFHTAKREALQSLKDDVKSTESQLQIALQTHGLLENVLKSQSEISCYDMYKTCSTRQKPPENDISYVTEIGLLDNVDTISENIDSESLQLGDITRGFEERGIRQSTKVTLMERIDTKLKDEEPGIFDVMVVFIGDIETVIVVDNINNKVKSFYTRGGREQRSVLSVSADPFQLTGLPDNKGAVAIFQTNQILMFTITPDLQIFRTIHTSHGYTGLTLLRDDTFACSWKTKTETGIDLIDHFGRVKLSLPSNELSRPVYITTKSEDTVLASDKETGTVKSVTDQGIVTTYESLSKELVLPRGIVKAKNGECFVVDKSSNRVLYFSESGEDWKVVLTDDDGLKEPSALFVDGRRLMYVSVENRYINVYRYAL